MTADLRVRVDARGSLASLWDVSNARERLAAGQSAPLLSIHRGPTAAGPHVVRRERPSRGARLPPERRQGPRAGRGHPTHVAFEVASVEPAGVVDAIVWGPYPTTVGDDGRGDRGRHAREGAFAIGLRVLNLKARGGALLNNEGSDPSRGTLAQSTPFGSVLQAFTLDRSRPRRRGQLQRANSPACPSRPCQVKRSPGRRSRSSRARRDRCWNGSAPSKSPRGQPHPMVKRSVGRSNGPTRVARTSSRPSPNPPWTSCSAYTRRAGLMTLYHPEPFATLGPLRSRSEGLPDRRRGHAARRRERPRARNPDWRAHADQLHQHERRIRVAGSRPPAGAHRVEPARGRHRRPRPTSACPRRTASPTRRRTGCTRSSSTRSWSGTAPFRRPSRGRSSAANAAPSARTAAPHAGAAVGKLVDHPYKVFFPTIDLQDESRGTWRRGSTRPASASSTSTAARAASRRARRLRAGPLRPGVLRQPRSPGRQRHEHLVAVTGTPTLLQLGRAVVRRVRESMQEYRIQNQALFDRHYVPNMLGCTG